MTEKHLPALPSILAHMAKGTRAPERADHKRLVGESLMLARTALHKRPVDFVRMYPTWLTSQSKLSNWEVGDNYPNIHFLIRLCDDHGFTMDWFYRQKLAGVSDGLADDLRAAEAEIAAASAAEADPQP